MEETHQEEVTEEIIQEPTENVDPGAPAEEAPPEGEQTPQEAAEQAEWDNFKYRVRDEEKEFDEWIRPVVKDEETYKRVQDFYTAQAGIELAKQERDEIQTKFETMNDSLNTVNRYVHSGDARGFIEALGLPKKMFIDYAINELKYQELSPEERARVDAENQGRLRMHQLEMQNEGLQKQYEEQQKQLEDQQGQQLRVQLDHGLNGSDILPYAQDYDTRVGRQGAFRQAVIDRGIFQAQVNGIDMSAQEAINDAINYLGLRAAGAPNQPNVQAGTQGHQQVHPASKPVIPNIQGRGTSPTGSKLPTSIDDIRRIRAEKLAAAGS